VLACIATASASAVSVDLEETRHKSHPDRRVGLVRTRAKAADKTSALTVGAPIFLADPHR
jgi:hypothetical protein